MQLTKTQNKIEQFAELINKGIESWLEAGKIVAEAIDEDPDFADKVCQKFPHITPEMVLRFEQIGRKKIHPHLLLHDGPGMRKLRCLTYDQQERLLKSGIPVLVHRGESDWDTLNIDPRNINSAQCRQAFNSDGTIRSQASQRAWIEEQKLISEPIKVQCDTPWRIVSGKIVIVEPCTFTTQELSSILSKALS
jgi:hypothetical protein